MESQLVDARKKWTHPMPDKLLLGKNILISGAGDGIGAAAARCFACFGANIILLGKTQSKLEQVFDSIQSHTDTDPVIVSYDLANYKDGGLNALREMVIEHYGHLDGLLHNAGILGDKTPLEHYNLDLWERVMQINVSAVHALTQAMLPALRKSKSASVVFTSSSVGRQARAYWGAYAVSKFAIEGMAQVLADETEAAGVIRVNSINPGATRTAMRAAAYPNEDPRTLQSAEEKMDLYLYLFGESSKGVSGQQFSCANWEP